MPWRPCGRSGFSLIELTIVVIIVGVLGALAIPRISRAAAGVGQNALVNDLAALRKAIGSYQAEHHGRLPDSALTLANQLTMYTDESGGVSPSPTSKHIYGPYLRRMPPLPVGKNQGSAGVRDLANVGTAEAGWFYRPGTGEIFANTKDHEVDSSGVPYNRY